MPSPADPASSLLGRLRAFWRGGPHVDLASREDFRDARLLSIGELVRFLSTHHGLGIEVEVSKGRRDDRRNVIVSATKSRPSSELKSSPGG